MSDEKWQDPSNRVLNPRYIVFSLIATVLIAVGLLGHFHPELLAALGDEVTNKIQENWLVLIGAGVVVGSINAILTLSARKQDKQTQ